MRNYQFMEQIAFKVDKKTCESFNSIAEKKDLTVSDTLRKAISDKLERTDTKELKNDRLDAVNTFIEVYG